MTAKTISLSLDKVSFSYGGIKVIDQLTLDIIEGQITTILGANGCGKSTLLGLLSKGLMPQEGDIFLKGKTISHMGLKVFAKQVAMVHQNQQPIADMTVYDMVAMGRFPYQRFFQRDKGKDDDAINWALEVTGLANLAYRCLQDLSGGERQRVWIARALAQKAPILILDEPTTYLDVKYQLEILTLIKKINQDCGMTIIMVLHDINHALAVSDTIVGLKEGKVYGQGSVETVIDEAFIETIFGVYLPLVTIDGKPYLMHTLGQTS
ncbi:ABC transporter ATP-binding protein [Streptococcus ictaluri]|uniref:ABC transporter, ATP-binding protein n=1 Tax=Streptococcus ictaluri 707-05 TaxID=764299 RepID=G5JZY7_9STRE|nr:ABC transporter ATP-binding protein [Streptococcus ictaluri]EHI70775.1 ABC transporter, ATP-binding protein [Streptococcus ictaluri 707-05]